MLLEQMPLPPEWRIVPIREAFAFTQKPRGVRPAADADVPFLPMELLPLGGRTVVTYELRLSKHVTSGTYVENGDLLVARITPSFENGKQAMLAWDRPFGYASTEVIPLRAIQDAGSLEFLSNVLLHPAIRSDLAGKMDGTTGRQRLSKATLGDRLIPLPPLAEQQAIASVLDTVRQAIEQQERLLALAGELKQALASRLFSTGIRGELGVESEIGPTPESWAVRPLGEHLLLAQYGISVRGGDVGPHALLRMTNQRNGRIVGSNLQYVDLPPGQFRDFHVARGDLLFNRTNSFELVGRTALFDLEGDFTFASYLIRLRTDEARLRPAFLNHYFNTAETQRRLKSIATRAVSQSNISATRLRGFPVPVPPIAEQDEIVAALDAVDAKRQMHARKRDALSALFRTLLHQLMTGQLRVHDLDLAALEPAAA